jgi:hypothetical protein
MVSLRVLSRQRGLMGLPGTEATVGHCALPIGSRDLSARNNWHCCTGFNQDPGNPGSGTDGRQGTCMRRCVDVYCRWEDGKREDGREAGREAGREDEGLVAEVGPGLRPISYITSTFSPSSFLLLHTPQRSIPSFFFNSHSF